MVVLNERVDGLVLDYLLQQCNEKSARHLVHESSHALRATVDLGSKEVLHPVMSARRRIKDSIFKGDIDDAILTIKLNFPSILDTNNLLHFTLLRLSLIEIIRTHKMQSPAECSDQSERVFLDKVLSFVHNNLISKVAHSAILFKELELTMSLLCFRFDPEISDAKDQPDFPTELKALFSYSLRYRCHTMVDQAILNWIDQRGNDDGSGRYTDAATTVNWSSYDCQSSEFTGPSYGVGFGAHNYSLDTSTNESQAVQGPDCFKYKVSVPRAHLATESLDRMRVSRTSSERLFGTKESDLVAYEVSAPDSGSSLENVLQLWLSTDRLLRSDTVSSPTFSSTTMTTAE